MIRRPPISTRTDTLCPYTTLFRSRVDQLRQRRRGGADDESHACGSGPVFAQGNPARGHRHAAHRRIGRRGALSTMGRPSHRGIHMHVASPLPRRACLALLLAFSCGTVSAGSAEHTSALQSLMRTTYAVFCLKNKNTTYYCLTT